MFFLRREAYTNPLCKDFNILKFHDKAALENSIFIHKSFKHQFPQPFDNWFGLSSNFHTPNTRWSNLDCLNVPCHRTKLYGRYVWHDFLHNISSSYPYCLKDYRLFVQLKMAWNFIFAFPSGTWRGFGGDGMGLHEAFLVVPLRDVEMKIFILTFSLVQHWNRRLIININEFLTTSARAIPLVLASLCGNSPLTFNLFVYLLSTSYC